MDDELIEDPDVHTGGAASFKAMLAARERATLAFRLHKERLLGTPVRSDARHQEAIA